MFALYRFLIVSVLLSLSLCGLSPAATQTILVEAESFDKCGGWVVDQQFMDEMGSPFLLAHGLGIPVEDAQTTVRLPETGDYRIWIRTRDWVGPWKTASTAPPKRASGTPGKFQVLINGAPLKPTFGVKDARWKWQDSGVVAIKRKRLTLALHDLTGFEGRCDAILFSKDRDFNPPNRDPEMAAFRRKLLGHPDKAPNAGEYDLVVVGGGIAGTCTAISAARNGLEVALIQDRPVIGGNNSSEIRVWLQGKIHGERYPRLGDVVQELEQKKSAHYGPENTADLYEDDKKIALVKAEKNIAFFPCYRANKVETKNGSVIAVIAQNIRTGERLCFPGRWFADCTGDGGIGFLAGADYDMTLDGHMGRCNLWNVKDTGKPVSFPRCPWALDLSDKPFPGRGGEGGIQKLGGWYWESGYYHDPFEKGEYIRDWNFRAMYGAWDCLKNVDKIYPNHTLNWCAYISGKRESRRLLGDVILTKEDLLSSKDFEDGCVVTGWKIDLHLPNKKYEKGFEADAFLATAHYTDYKRPYLIPYRCFYSRNISNLYMAGRDISVTHEALGTVRVMRTDGLMGEVVGLAACLCKKYNVNPRDVYTCHLKEFKQLLQRGVNP